MKLAMSENATGQNYTQRKVNQGQRIPNFSHLHASVRQQKFVGRLLAMLELDIAGSESRLDLIVKVFFVNSQPDANAYQQSQGKNHKIQNSKHLR
jgi:hypothetical protein